MAIKRVEFPNHVIIPIIIEELHKGHTATLNLRGWSMRPFLEHDRDKALLCLPGEVKVGDPVLAEVPAAQGDGTRYVLHRIIRIEGDEVTLKGDGNLNEEHCLKSDICAAVVGFYRKGRKTLDRTDGWKWRIYSWWWMRLTPIRRYLLAFHRRIWLKIFKPKTIQ